MVSLGVSVAVKHVVVEPFGTQCGQLSQLSCRCFVVSACLRLWVGGDLRSHGLESWSWTQLFGFRSQEIASGGIRWHQVAKVAIGSKAGNFVP